MDTLHAALFNRSPVPMQVYELVEDKIVLVAANQAAFDASHHDFSDRIGMALEKAFPRAANLIGPVRTCITEQAEIDLGDVEYGDTQIEWQVFSVKLSPVDNQTAVATYENVTSLRQLENAVRVYLKDRPDREQPSPETTPENLVAFLEDAATNQTSREGIRILAFSVATGVLFLLLASVVAVFLLLRQT